MCLSKCVHSIVCEGALNTELWWVRAYLAADIATFGYLMYSDWPDMNWWNWIILIPINVFLAQIWPIYWGLLHWIF